MKKYTAERKKTLIIAGIKRLSHKVTDSTDTSVWENYVQHVDGLQEEVLAKVMQDEVLEPIIINLMESDSDDSAGDYDNL
jgi:hypothetical protein